MKFIYIAAALVALTAPAFAQKQMPRYGEPDPDKTPSELEAERKVERDYKRSIGNVPNAGPADPWGGVRGENSPKPSAKAAPKAAPKNVKPAPAPN